jgi:hypothetical protein
MLLHNETPSGNRLRVRVAASSSGLLAGEFVAPTPRKRVIRARL